MKTKPRVISFHYTLKNQAGETLDSSSGSEPLTYLEGSGQIIPGLEKALSLLNVGDTRNVKVLAADAYGERDPQMTIQVPRSQLPQTKEIAVGDRFSASSPEGSHGHSAVFTAIAVTDSHVTLDGNHPLAGVDLFFDVEITASRDATDEEMAHGHAHGPNGHHH